MKIRHLLAVAAVSTAAASASAFEWQPFIMQPSENSEVTQAYMLESLRFSAEANLIATDVMPKWVDENGHEIIGAYSSFSDPIWQEYMYDFNLADFKTNGEYTLIFPEGMMKNTAGELSAEKEFYYTVLVDQLGSGMFDDFKVLSISPDLSEPQALWNNQVVTVNTNHNDAIAYTELNVYDKTIGDGVIFSSNFTTDRTIGNSSPITWEVVGDYKFFENHIYSAEFIFYNGTNLTDSEGNPTPIVAKEVVEFTGRVEGYKYADVTLLGIDPAPGTLTISEPAQAVFQYTFSGPVNVYRVESPRGMLGNEVYPSSYFTSNEDKTVWTINLSESDYIKTVDAELALQVYARDLEGSQVKGNFGEEGNSCFEYAWPCDIGGESVEVVTPTAGESLDKLTEVVIKSANGEKMTWSNNSEITIETIGRNTPIATLVYERPEGADSDEATEFRFTKWVLADEWSGQPIDLVAEGSYVIHVGSGCFVFGEQYSSKNSRTLYSGFQITGALEEKPDPVDPKEQEVFEYTLINPEPDTAVESLEKIQLWFPDEVSCEQFEVSVYDANQTLVTTGLGLYDWDDLYLINIDLAQPITAAGEYTVVIPARVIGNLKFFESDHTAGICNPEFNFTYTIGAAPEGLQFDSAYPAVGSEVKTLDTIILNFSEPAICGEDFVVNVYSAARNVYTTGVGNNDFGDPTRVVINLNEPIVEDGRYDVVVPAGVIVNAEYYESKGESGLTNPEYHLTYIVDNSGSDDPVDPSEQQTFIYEKVEPAEGSIVDQLSEITLWFPDVVMTNGGAAFVYKAGTADLVTTAAVAWTPVDDYQIDVTLLNAITEDGDYDVVIPAGTICDDAFFMSDGKSGICNPEIRLTYTVNTGSGVAGISSASIVNVYDVQGRVVLKNASASDVKKLSKGIYIVNGKKVVVK